MDPRTQSHDCRDAAQGRRRWSFVSGVRPKWKLVLRFALLLGTLFALQITIAVAQEPSVKLRLIVNPANPVNSVEREFLADAFLKKTTRWPDGEAIHPFDQRVDSLVRRAFSDSILHRSVAAVRNYWQQRIFSGRGVPPAELESDEAVVRRVQGDRFAVGYVSERADAASVKIIGVR